MITLTLTLKWIPTILTIVSYLIGDLHSGAKNECSGANCYASFTSKKKRGLYEK